MDIKVLGPGCRNCRTLEANTLEALAALGLNEKVGKVVDYSQIVAYGVMQTPGLVVNGKVVASGRVPSADEIKRILAAA